MPIYVGTNKIKKIYVGTTKIKKVYSGSTLVWTSSIPASNLAIGQIVYVPYASGALMKSIVAFKNYSGYPSNSVSLVALPDATITVYNGNNPNSYISTPTYSGFSFHPKINSHFETLKATLVSACLTTTVSATWESQDTNITITAKAFAPSGDEIVAMTDKVRYEIDLPDTQYNVLLRDQRSVRVKYDDGWSSYSGFDTFSCYSLTSYEIFDVRGMVTSFPHKTRYIFNIPNTLEFVEQNGSLVLDI